VVVDGFSTPREVTQASFSFTPAPGKTLQNATLTIPNVGDAFTNWYQSPDSLQEGSQFRLTVPFTVQGNADDVASVSVTLTNSVGTSQPQSPK
jgi:hypothetical protein